MKRILVALVLVAPLANAHAIPADLTVGVLGALPWEDEAPLEREVLFQYHCGGITRNATEPNMSVAFSVLDAPAWAILRVEPAQMALETCEGTAVARATLSAAAKREAGTPTTARVQAAWSTAGYVLNLTADVLLEPQWLGGFEAVLAESERTEKPQTPVVFPLKLVNKGHATTRFAFEVVDKTENLQVPVPNPVVLPGGAQADVPITVQTPYKNGYVRDEGSVTFRVTPSAALDPTQRGEPQEFTVKVNTQGAYVPAPSALLVLGLIGLLALRLRRR